MKRANAAVAAVAALGLAGFAMAEGTIYEIDISGINSWDLEGDASNETLDIDLAGLGIAPENWVLTGIGWNVTLDAGPQPDGASWLSEASISFADQGAAPGLFLTVGTGDSFPGLADYSSDVLKLDDLMIPNIDVSSGFLHLEFFESFDDIADAIDATYVSGTLSLQFIPAPGALALLGLAGLVGSRRRR